MNILLTAVVGLLTSLLPSIESAVGASAIVDQIITTLVSLIPQVAQLAEDLLPEIQNVIAALQSNTVITPAQMQALEALQAQADAAFEAAAAAAGDPATPPAPASS